MGGNETWVGTSEMEGHATSQNGLLSERTQECRSKNCADKIVEMAWKSKSEVAKVGGELKNSDLRRRQETLEQG